RVQQLLQQTLAPVEYISCGNSSDGSSKDSVGEGTGDRAFVGASETRYANGTTLHAGDEPSPPNPAFGEIVAYADAGFTLNGDLRGFRKRCPYAKIFQQLPRKLRLKNNQKVNVFCDAVFWQQGLAKLLSQVGRHG